jgi:hypothetical protein
LELFQQPVGRQNLFLDLDLCRFGCNRIPVRADAALQPLGGFRDITPAWFRSTRMISAPWRTISAIWEEK